MLLIVGSLRSAYFVANSPRQVGRRIHARAAELRGDSAVIVEGLADRRAVQRAVPNAVFVLGSSTWVDGRNAERVLQKLERGLPHFSRAVVLLDPDVAGRQGRNKLESRFPGRMWHAFIPAPQATATKSTKWHTAGNIGIEHASPAAIRAALEGARPAIAGRTEISKDLLLECKLTATHTATPGTDVKWRRELVCAILGIGSCDGRQLLKQLNMYGFTQADLSSAVEQAEQIMASGPQPAAR